MYVESTTDARSCNKYYIFCVCICIALGIQHAIHVRHIVICGLSGWTDFSTLSHKKIIQLKMCFHFPLQILSETFFLLRRTERNVWKMCISLHVKCPFFFSDCNETLIFSTDFPKIFSYQIPRKSVQWPQMFHAERQTDRQTDMTKIIVAFHSFSKSA